MKSWITLAPLVILSVVLTFLAAEFSFRALLDVPQLIHQSEVDRIAHVPRPYVMFSGNPEAVDHNSLGYKGNEILPSKKKGEFRIFIHGGSTVYNGNELSENTERIKQAENDRDKLVQELVNDPDAIDDKLEEIGIKEI